MNKENCALKLVDEIILRMLSFLRLHIIERNLISVKLITIT